MLSSGIPGIADYLALDEEREFGRLYEYSRMFRSKADDGSSRLYGAKWVDDPFLQWSRRWEYVYVLQRLETWWQHMPSSVDIADAGSGFTFFPFYLKELHPGARILCIDVDPTAGRAIEDATRVLGYGPKFALDDLEKLERPSESLDAAFSVSVIEHARNPGQVVEEIHRVLKPGGLFICTFDVSFERGSPMHVDRVEDLVHRLYELFEVVGGEEPGIGDSATCPDRVTTTWISREFPERLPWRNPRLVWLYDLLRGRFRTDFYRPMTFYCGTFSRKSR
jgi:SAM-dependent methyltransferase